MQMTAFPAPLRLAEATAVLALATDLSMGQPLEHGLRTALVAVRMAKAIGLPEDDQITVFYNGLLHFAGCTPGSDIDARFFGDELTARAQMATVPSGARTKNPGPCRGDRPCCPRGRPAPATSPASTAPGRASTSRCSSRSGTCT